MKSNIIESFEKIIKTVKSVKSEEQFFVAKQMIINFFSLYNTDINLSYYHKIYDVVNDKMTELKFERFILFCNRMDLQHTFFKINPNPKK